MSLNFTDFVSYAYWVICRSLKRYNYPDGVLYVICKNKQAITNSCYLNCPICQIYGSVVLWSNIQFSTCLENLFFVTNVIVGVAILRRMVRTTFMGEQYFVFGKLHMLCFQQFFQMAYVNSFMYKMFPNTLTWVSVFFVY